MKTIFFIITGKLTEKEFNKFTRDGRQVRIPDSTGLLFGDKPMEFYGGGVLEEQPEFVKAAFAAMKSKDERK